MSNKKITDLTELTTPTTDDVFPVVDIATNTTQKVQLGNLPTTPAVTSALASKQATLVSGTNIKTVNGNSVLGSGDINIPLTPPSGVSGAIQFSTGSAFASDASNLFWNNTTKRLGIGTNAPNTTLEVKAGNNGDVDFVNFTNGDGTNTARFKANGGFILGASSDFNLLPGTATLTRFGASFGFLSAPSAMVHIKGSGTTSGTTSLLVQNSGGTAALTVKDDLSTTFGGIIYTNGNVLEGSTTGRFDIRAQYDLSFQAGRTGGNGSFSFGNENSTPNASAIVDIVSTTKGFLPPRMTTTQRDLISSVATGLVLYNTTTNKLQCYNGSTWNDLF